MYNFNIIIESDRKELENMLTDDSVYLFLLKYDNQKMPAYTFIAKELGCTRQTVSKKVKNLIDQDLIQLNDDDKTIKVKKIEEEVIITEAENDNSEIRQKIEKLKEDNKVVLFISGENEIKQTLKNMVNIMKNL